MVGYKTRLDRDTGECTVTLDLEPRHLNRHGILHGGMVATLLDVVCGNTASHYFDPVDHAKLVTVSLNINYVGAGRAGRVTATAKSAGGGKSIAYVNGELRDAEGQMLATASGIFKRIRA
ncbi:MAG: hotdog fold thioesterase [Rhodobacteraceae bacterium]|nr:hotdog fold thioesterase [Paracoccaceae bacterium]